MGFDNLMLKFDQIVTNIMGEWDTLSTFLFTSVFGCFIYYVVTYQDPDAHPMLLARQAQASPVRQQGQSAVYRSHSAPHGIPLNTGLNIKDPGDSKWARGRDGDLRDIWRKVIAGPTDHEGNPSGRSGSILTVLGSETVIDHDIVEITRSINLIGQHIKQNGGSKVAIYLPNSVEYLATIFAGAFHSFTTILLPYDRSPKDIVSLLKLSNADTVVAAAGVFPFDVVVKNHPALKQVVWVVDEGNKHLDWNEVPKGTGGAVNVSTWQEIIQDRPANEGADLPKDADLKNVIAFWPAKGNGHFEPVEFTHRNLVAGIAAQVSGVPNTARLGPEDLFLPADSLSTIYPLVLTLAALFSNCSVALNSVADRSPDLVLATKGIAPTIIVASAASLAQTHRETSAKMTSPIAKAVHWVHTRTLLQNGIMPLASMFWRMHDSLRPVIGTTPGKLRLIYVADQAGVGTTPLSGTTLSDLRVYTGARIIYALTASKVAGAVAQTGMYDYRITGAPGDKYCHFGPPVSSVEVLFKDTKDLKTTDEVAVGEIIVRGPAVVDGEVALGVPGTIMADHTLAYV